MIKRLLKVITLALCLPFMLVSIISPLILFPLAGIGWIFNGDIDINEVTFFLFEKMMQLVDKIVE